MVANLAVWVSLMVFEITLERLVCLRWVLWWELLSPHSWRGLLRGAAGPRCKAVEAHCIGRVVAERQPVSRVSCRCKEVSSVGENSSHNAPVDSRKRPFCFFSHWRQAYMGKKDHRQKTTSLTNLKIKEVFQLCSWRLVWFHSGC